MTAFGHETPSSVASSRVCFPISVPAASSAHGSSRHKSCRKGAGAPKGTLGCGCSQHSHSRGEARSPL